ncbi:hypothetical protein V2J09_007061 [Rumex salicifolius]
MRVVMDDLRELNDIVLDDSLLLSPPPLSSSLGPDPFSIGSEPWIIAERATDEIIGQIQPTVASEERRRKVIDYVQRLLKSHIICEVFPFGSVPLKTYLPDGDIDLTVFGSSGLEEPLANVVTSILDAEDQNPSAECIVKDVQYIPAEVKLVKCLVQNIVVDISFNQLGGLCTLCFLEQVDRLIGKNHLFKRSIILIKAWCYYESRILGAHHGLISTYALETLVLYIFHLFHSSLNGPLAVLYKFLDYFSKFDWVNLCVSLSDPIPISSMPGIVKGVEKPENSGNDLLLSDDFLKECVEKFSVTARGAEASYRTFGQKHLNIVDPLRENNNLGRSVSKGNFFRIRSAFSYGARKLGQILQKPNEDISGEVCKFFTNTLDRHGKGMRPDVQDPLPSSVPEFTPELLLSSAELAQEDRSSHELELINSTGRYDRSRMDLDHSTTDWQQSGLQKSAFAEDREDLCASGNGEDMVTTGMSNSLHVSRFPTPNGSQSHHKFSHSLPNGKMKSKKNPSAQESLCTEDSQCSSSSSTSSSGRQSPEAIGCRETTILLRDLSGDFDNHLENLGDARKICDHALGASFPAMQWVPGNIPWDPSMQFPPPHMAPPNMFPQVNVNGVIPRPLPNFFHTPPMVPGAFGVEDPPRPRGTGTYFPNTNYYSYRDRPSLGKGRTQPPLKSPRGNGRAATFSEKSSHVKNINRDQSIAQSPSPSPRGKPRKDINGFIEPGERVEECTSNHQPPPVPSSSEEGRAQPNSTSALATESSPVMNDNRLAVQLYHLKDEEDFPPLSI